MYIHMYSIYGCTQNICFNGTHVYYSIAIPITHFQWCQIIQMVGIVKSRLSQNYFQIYESLMRVNTDN